MFLNKEPRVLFNIFMVAVAETSPMFSLSFLNFKWTQFGDTETLSKTIKKPFIYR